MVKHAGSDKGVLHFNIMGPGALQDRQSSPLGGWARPIYVALRGCEFFFVAINYVDEETHVKRLFLSILALLAFSRVIF